MDQSLLNEIISKLSSKEVNKPCPRCGKPNFSVIGESIIPIQENPNAITLGGPSIPTIIIACNNCGYVTQHAKGPLGLLKGEAK